MGVDRSYFFKRVVMFSIIFVFVFILGFFALSFLNSVNIVDKLPGGSEDFISGDFGGRSQDLSSNEGSFGASEDFSSSSSSSGSGGSEGSGSSSIGSGGESEDIDYSENSCSLVRPGSVEGVDCNLKSMDSEGVVLTISNQNVKVVSASLSLEGCGSDSASLPVGDTDFSFSCSIGENFDGDLTVTFSLTEGSVEVNGFVIGSISN